MIDKVQTTISTERFNYYLSLETHGLLPNLPLLVCTHGNTPMVSYPTPAPTCLYRPMVYDNISMRVIKHSFHLISAPLTNIINLSLLKGIFPDKLKIGKVIPIYKTEDPSLFVNYRPISMLPNFSKFFEKVMYNRLVEFAETNEVFYLRQFGFRKNHSTSHALIHLLKVYMTDFFLFA